MRMLLNVGLEQGSTGTFNSVDDTLAVLGMHVHVRYHALVESDTEPTVVVLAEDSIGPTSVRGALYAVAQALGQQAIAVWDPMTQRGALVGPQADAWGEFNPAFFILPSGRRLADALREIAVARPTTRVFAGVEAEEA